MLVKNAVYKVDHCRAKLIVALDTARKSRADVRAATNLLNGALKALSDAVITKSNNATVLAE